MLTNVNVHSFTHNNFNNFWEFCQHILWKWRKMFLEWETQCKRTWRLNDIWRSMTFDTVSCVVTWLFSPSEKLSKISEFLFNHKWVHVMNFICMVSYRKYISENNSWNPDCIHLTKMVDFNLNTLIINFRHLFFFLGNIITVIHYKNILSSVHIKSFCPYV